MQCQSFTAWLSPNPCMIQRRSIIGCAVRPSSGSASRYNLLRCVAHQKIEEKKEAVRILLFILSVLLADCLFITNQNPRSVGMDSYVDGLGTPISRVSHVHKPRIQNMLTRSRMTLSIILRTKFAQVDPNFVSGQIV